MRFDTLCSHHGMQSLRPVCGLTLQWSASLIKRRGGRCIALAIVLMMDVAVSVCSAPPGHADFAGDLRGAVAQARDVKCAPLRPEQLADQTAAVVTRSTENYLDHTARAVPVEDPLPILKDLGLNVGRAKLLQGAGKTEADAIEAIVLSGYDVIPDCAYSEYGASALPNSNQGGYFLTAVVLAGS